MSGLIRTLLPVCLIVALSLGAAPADAQTKDPAVIANVRLVSDTGQTVRLGDLRGKVVFINFWGVWCPPCGREMPSIRTLQSSLQDRSNDIEFVFISALHDSFAKDNAHFKELGMAGHNYDWAKRKSEQWEFFMGAGAGTFHFLAPTTYILDRNGKVVMMRSGASVPWEIHTAEVRALLDNK